MTGSDGSGKKKNNNYSNNNQTNNNSIRQLGTRTSKTNDKEPRSRQKNYSKNNNIRIHNINDQRRIYREGVNKRGQTFFAGGAIFVYPSFPSPGIFRRNIKSLKNKCIIFKKKKDILNFHIIVKNDCVYKFI